MISDDLVTMWVRANNGDSNRLDDATRKGGAFKALFKDQRDIRPTAKNVRELNLDHAVLGLPSKLQAEKAGLDEHNRPLVKIIGEDSLITDEDKALAEAGKPIPHELKQLMGMREADHEKEAAAAIEGRESAEFQGDLMQVANLIQDAGANLGGYGAPSAADNFSDAGSNASRPDKKALSGKFQGTSTEYGHAPNKHMPHTKNERWQEYVKQHRKMAQSGKLNLAQTTTGGFHTRNNSPKKKFGDANNYQTSGNNARAVDPRTGRPTGILSQTGALITHIDENSKTMLDQSAKSITTMPKPVRKLPAYLQNRRDVPKGFPKREGKVDVVPEIDHETWDQEEHRLRMRFRGGRDAAEGKSGTWAPDHEGIVGPAKISHEIWKKGGEPTYGVGGASTWANTKK